MTTVHTTRESHVNRDKFRIRHEDAMGVLGPEAHAPFPSANPIITSNSTIAIVGAGFGGLATAIMCKDQFKTDDFVVFDKHEQWGGTWWANTYPGCASDIPALWYSLFSALNNNWSELRPPQYEMEEYILEVVKLRDLQKHARFGILTQQMVYNTDHGNWTIHGINVKTGQRYEHISTVVFSCKGGLVQPQQLRAPGLDRFQGHYMHSALWDHSVDFTDKNVVVVGNGCSAVQVVPALVDDLKVKSVTQVFRSKHWIRPPLPEGLYRLYKLAAYSRIGMVILRWFAAVVAELNYPMFQGNGIVARSLRWLNMRSCRSYVLGNSPKKYHQLLIPDYKIGCKRTICDYKYIPTLSNPKVQLTNSTIAQVGDHWVELDDGTRVDADIIVACTGYDLTKSFSESGTVVGRHGVNVKQLWKQEGTTAYRTAMIRDCPNFFLIGGPNSATGHSSVVSAIENSCALAARAIRPVLRGEAKSVVVKRSAYYSWFEFTQKKLLTGVFGSGFGGCNSWYSSGGINATTYPASQVHFWLTVRQDHLNDFEYEPMKKTKVD